MSKSNSLPLAGHYNANYGNFQTELYAQIRREGFGEDIGQNSWLTSDEQDRFLEWLDLSPGKTLLDVACGAGGPALRIAATTGCSVIGIDVHEQAVTTASLLAKQSGLVERAEFRVADATRSLPFSDATFDAITCIIAVRSSAGFYLFVPHGYDERAIAQCGLRLLVCEDVTENMAKVAEARRAARAARSTALREIEGDQAYDGQQEFLAIAARLAREGRLSRFLYVSTKSS